LKGGKKGREDATPGAQTKQGGAMALINYDKRGQIVIIQRMKS
jgi:hypothetical protein